MTIVGAAVRQSALTLTLALLMAACSRGEMPDAYGNVEATEVTVSAEVAGRLIAFDVREGQSVMTGAVAARIDPAELQLQRDQAAAQRAATESRVDETARQRPVIEAQRATAASQVDAARAQLAALESQLEIARRSLDRTRRLIEQQAATSQQLDQAERDVRVLEDQSKAQAAQIAAQERQVAMYTGQLAAIDAQRRTAARQVTTASTQVAVVEDRLRRATVTNPVGGTVLATYVEAGEFVQPGQPLYAIADLSAVDVRAYVSETQLASVHVGEQAQITFDVGDNRQSLPGTVTWIASDAQFTPTPIQTREERADLVYAVKMRVDNSKRLLKLGMPVDVQFGSR